MSAPPTPIREQIREAAAVRLEAIQAGAGYRQTVARVWRRPVFDAELQELPALIILPADDENEKTYQELDGGVIDGWMGLDVIIIAAGTLEITTVTVLEELLADVEIALTAADLHLGLSADTVLDIRDTGRLAWEEGGPRNERGAVMATYRVWYQYTRGNP